MTVAEAISAAIYARENCMESNNFAWVSRWDDRLRELEDMLPSGSGFDSGTQILKNESSTDRIVLQTSFHHMVEGYYDGWTDHRIIVRPSFIGGFKLTVGGSNRNDIKEYIYETFEYELSSEYRSMIDISWEKDVQEESQ